MCDFWQDNNMYYSMYIIYVKQFDSNYLVLPDTCIGIFYPTFEVEQKMFLLP